MRVRLDACGMDNGIWGWKAEVAENAHKTEGHSENWKPLAHGTLRWYVAKVHEGHEDSIARRCRKLMAPSVLADCFSPKVELLRKVGGTWRKVEQSLYPGYLFMVSPDPQALAKALKALSFSVNLVGERDDGSHAPLAPSEQGWLETALNEDYVLMMSRGVIGDGVTIVQEGPLIENEHRICRIDRHKRVATVKIEMPDGTTLVKAGLEITEKS